MFSAACLRVLASLYNASRMEGPTCSMLNGAGVPRGCLSLKPTGVDADKHREAWFVHRKQTVNASQTKEEEEKLEELTNGIAFPQAKVARSSS